MRWTRIAPESLLDGVGIWIDSRLISYQSFLSPIVRAVSAAAYLGSEDCGTLVVGKGVRSPADELAQGFRGDWQKQHVAP
jgi:hypothetical protein